MASQPLSLDMLVNSLRISVIQNNNNNGAISQERTIFFYICDNEQVYMKQAYKSNLCVAVLYSVEVACERVTTVSKYIVKKLVCWLKLQKYCFRAQLRRKLNR